MQNRIFYHYYKQYHNYYLINTEYLKMRNNNFIKAYGKIFLSLNGHLTYIYKISKLLTTHKKLTKSSKVYGIKEIG